ncbi:hypothetical protein GBAR_LOCUS6972 [Geodia barretti]|uniref:Uncharacterized protein n=1 Tax=Geodia barretti TaxID=519541 RepID=A0AA35WEM6_GEOBA|nr:hypothetical protein GBAR_LOCUS6972 [Geodia barretti]
MDRVVTDLLQSQSSLCSDWNLSSVIFGKYGASESLLHLLVRCKLEGAVGVLLQHRNRGSKEAILQQRDYKGRTPSEIARKKGSKRTAEMLAMASVNSTEGNERTVKITKLMKCKSLDHKLNLIGTTEQDNELLSSVKVNGEKHCNKRRFRLHSDKKGVTITKPQSPPPTSDDWQFSEEVCTAST